MNTRRHLLIALLLLCLSGVGIPLHAQQTADSLRRVAEGLPHETERLDLLYEVARMTQVAPEGIRDAKALYREAGLQQNDSMRCTGAAYIVNHFYLFGDNATDSIRKWSEVALPIARRVSLWQVYFEVQRILISAYIYADRFEYALDEARKMEQEAQQINNADGLLNAYLCQGMAYQGSNQWREAMQSYLKGHRLTLRQSSPLLQLNLVLQILTMLLENDHYADMQPYIDETRETMEAIIQVKPQFREAFGDNYFLLDGFSSLFYLSTGQPKKAEKHLRAMEQRLATLDNPSYRKLYMDAMAYYHLQRAEYDRALALNDSSRIMTEALHMPVSDLLKVVKQRADIYFALGDYPRAVPLYREVKQRRDSLSKAISDRQMAEIKEMYEMDRLTLEEARMKTRVHLGIIAITLVILMVGLFYYLRICKMNRRLRRSTEATRQAMQTSEEANEMKRHFLATMSHAIRVPLHSVVGFSQLLATDKSLTDEERTEYAGIIHADTDKLMFLVNSVLDLSRLEAGMTKWQLADYDLVQLLHDAVGMARMQYEGLHITTVCDVAQYPLHADTGRLLQVFVSMLAGTVTTAHRVTEEVTFRIRCEGEALCGEVVPSPLADVRRQNQESLLRHDINRLTLQHFGGSYEVDEAAGGIRFSIQPIIKIEKQE